MAIKLRNIFILFLAYYIPGKLGFLLSLEPDNATAIWPSSGFASAGVVLLGYSSLPGVFLGSLVLNLHHKMTFIEMLSPEIFIHLHKSFWIAIGACTESFLVSYIIRKFIGFPSPLSHWKDILILFLAAGLIGAIPSPTIGVSTLYFMGYIPLSSCLYHWYSWWVGNSLGIVSIAPILITLFSPHKYISKKRKFYVFVPLLTVLIIISNIFINTNNYEKRKLQQNLEYEAQVAISDLANYIDNYFREIDTIKSFYEASNFVDRKEFNSFIKRLTDSSESLHLVEWIPKITLQQKPSIIKQAQDDGLKDFTITEYNDNQELQEAIDKEVYYPILYSKPSNRYNQFGLDILSTTTRKNIMLEAMNSGNVTSDIVNNLRNNIKNLRSLLIFQPIYKKNAKIDTIADRQKNIDGFIAATFRIDILITYFAKDLKKKGIDITISDKEKTEVNNGIVFRSFRGKPKFLLETSKDLVTNKKTWNIKFQQQEDYLIQNKEWHLWYLLIAGLIFETLAAILTLIITGYSDSIQKLVEKKTQQLQDSEKRFDLAVKGTRVGIWDWSDISDETQYWSPEFTRLLGYEPDELIAKRSNFEKMIHPKDLPAMQKALNAHIKHDKIFDIEHRMKTKSGKYKWFQSRGMITEDSQTGIKRMTGAIINIQDHKKAEEALQKSKEEAESATKMKSEFLATVSHEIRTPMNGIIGITELALETKLTKQQTIYLNNVLYSAENLLEILNDILDFSKIEAGKMDLELMPFNLKDAAQEVIDLLQPKAQQKNIALELKFNKNTNEYLIGDSIRIRQILHNLVGNSIKFTEKGSVTITISNQESVTLPKGKEMIMVSVQDTGIGLTKEQRRSIFNKFVQADGSTTRKFGGTGLGLSICQMLVSMIGGEIGVESEPGRGSNFYFTMLLDISTEKDIADKAPKISISKLTKDLIESKVLMAEDNRINAEFAKEMLEKLKCDVTIVRNGQEAFNLLKTGDNFDLIFMDCQMPIMDGFEATKHIRNYEKANNLGRIPIIALTANAMKGDRERCIKSGMDDYLSKPVRQKDFANKILEWHNKK